MPGLTFFLNPYDRNKEKSNRILLKLQSVFKVPSLNYLENYFIDDSFLIYSCVPDFITTQKLLTFNDFIIALDGDFYNNTELMIYLKHGNLSKLEIIYYLFQREGKNFANYLNGEFNIIVYN